MVYFGKGGEGSKIVVKDLDLQCRKYDEESGPIKNVSP